MEWKLDRVRNTNENEVKKILQSYIKYDNKQYDTLEMGKELVRSKIIIDFTTPDMPISEIERLYKKKWGSYIGIFTSNGFGYAKNIGNRKMFYISNVAKKLMSNEISYAEFITEQLAKIQFPKPNGPDYNEQTKEDSVKPFIMILKVLSILYSVDTYCNWIDSYDIVEHLEKNQYDCDYLQLTYRILDDRKNGVIRDVNFYGRDILMNKCLETGLFIKNDNKYLLKSNKIEYVQNIIKKHETSVFLAEKEHWDEYFGGEI